MFDAKQFLIDFHIPYWTEGKNCQAGWINIQCPHCNDSSNHGGFNLAMGYYNCWKCGRSSLEYTIGILTGTNKSAAESILEEYTINYNREAIQKKKKKTSTKELKLPGTFKALETMHKKYLKKRNFNPEYLERVWDLKGSGKVGAYKFRIIAPIYVNEKLISYQGRDITEKSSLRYKACKIEDEMIHHKYVLYGIDKVRKRKAIIVEGITDVWRLGEGSVCTFGTSFTPQQVNFAAQFLDEAFLLFDAGDKKAAEKASSMAYQLSGLGVKTEIIEFINHSGDPGELNPLEAIQLRKAILKY